MKYLICLLILGCSTGTAKVVSLKPNGRTIPFTVECSPNINYCQDLVKNTCKSNHYLIINKGSMKYNRYWISVQCKEDKDE